MEMFSHVKRGYNPEEVNAYINTLEQVIKSYKDKDNAIKNAIISAQVAADNIVKNAQAQAGEYKTQLRRQLQATKESVEKQRSEVSLFQDTYNVMLRKYLKEIEESEINIIDQHLMKIENTIESLGKDIDYETPVEVSLKIEETPIVEQVEEEEPIS